MVNLTKKKHYSILRKPRDFESEIERSDNLYVAFEFD